MSENKTVADILKNSSTSDTPPPSGGPRGEIGAAAPHIQRSAQESTISPAVDIAILAKQIIELQKKVDSKASKQEVAKAITPSTEVEEKIDWTKIEEKDIYDLSVPIPAIEQEVPDYLNMHVLDKNYVTRWIHTVRQRLGPCLAAGYTYVAREELDPQYPVSLEPDAQGHYSFGDVVLLKIQKSRYFAAIRRNHEKSMSIHGIGQVKGKLNNQIANSNPRLNSAIDRGAISFYDQEAIEETNSDLVNL